MRPITEWFQRPKADHNLIVDNDRDYTQADVDLLSVIFSAEEAQKHLLNIVSPKTISPEEVLKDAAGMDMMRRTQAWKTYERAVWRKLLTALRRSISDETVEKRESARGQVLAHLADLHLPYELEFARKAIERTRELEKQAQ